jgi:Tol biopolymer transport system component
MAVALTILWGDMTLILERVHCSRRLAFLGVTILWTVVTPGASAQGHQPPKRFYQGVSLSPDGRRIGLTVYNEGNLDIYTLRPDGSDLSRLTSDSAAELWESWSPDSKRLLYTVVNGDHTMDLYVMNADGSGKTLAKSGSGRGGYASWSPDGRRVLFERKADGVEQIFVMDKDGGNERRISQVPVAGGNARWSPDGGRIAFETSPTNAPDQIYVIDADGSHQTQVTHDTLFSVFPNWTADGRVAFIRKGALYAVNADGSGERLLRPAVSYAVFSRDGRRMVFLGREPGAPGGMFASHLYVADADGRSARPLPLPLDP